MGGGTYWVAKANMKESFTVAMSRRSITISPNKPRRPDRCLTGIRVNFSSITPMWHDAVYEVYSLNRDFKWLTKFVLIKQTQLVMPGTGTVYG